MNPQVSRTVIIDEMERGHIELQSQLLSVLDRLKSTNDKLFGSIPCDPCKNPCVPEPSGKIHRLGQLHKQTSSIVSSIGEELNKLETFA